MKTVIVTRFIFAFCWCFTLHTIYPVVFSTPQKLTESLYAPSTYIFLGLLATGMTYFLTMRKNKQGSEQ